MQGKKKECRDRGAVTNEFSNESLGAGAHAGRKIPMEGRVSSSCVNVAKRQKHGRKTLLKKKGPFVGAQVGTSIRWNEHSREGGGGDDGEGTTRRIFVGGDQTVFKSDKTKGGVECIRGTHTEGHLCERQGVMGGKIRFGDGGAQNYT